MASILALSCSISESIPLENKTIETQIEYETTLHARFAMSAVIRGEPSACAKIIESLIAFSLALPSKGACVRSFPFISFVLKALNSQK